jgi:serine protease Do
VGINTAIASNTGSYQGVGFAIPINLAKWVAGQLMKAGTVQRAYLGVGIGSIDGPLARHLGVDHTKGVLVSEVFPESPAAKAGFQEGDVVLSFAGREVHSPRELQETVERLPTGSKQRVDIIRDGKPKKLEVVIERMPEDYGIASRPALGGRGGDGSSGYDSSELGLEVAELTDELAERLGYEGFSGVLITGVDNDGAAAEKGIREGMLILRVGKQPVKSVAEFKAAMEDQSLEDGIMLLIRTQGGNRFVLLEPS